MIICSKCNKNIPNESLFCPLCGHAVFKESIIFSRTTAGFDPNNPENKPWKDRPLVPVRNYIIRNNTKERWYPTMKQKQKPTKGMKRFVKMEDDGLISVSGNSVASSLSLTGSLQDSNPVHDSIHEELQNDADLSRSIEEQLVRERVSPLVTYDIKVEENEKYFLLVSLVTQSYGIASIRLCWLRLALLCERSSQNNKSDDSSQTSELKETNQDDSDGKDSAMKSAILVFIPNHYGKLLAPIDSEWIDLFAINPDDYYMMQYLEKKYQFLCNRVKPAVEPSLLTPREKRFYKVYMEVKRSKYEIPDEILSELAVVPSAFANQVQLHMDAILPDSSNDAIISDYIFDEWTTPFKSRLRLNRNYSIPYCNVLISAKLNFRHRFGSNVQQESFSIQSISNKKQFQETMKVTDIDLRIEPLASSLQGRTNQLSDEEHIITLPSTEINIELPAMNELLKTDKMNDIEDVLRESMDNPQLFTDYLLLLVRMFYLEYSDHGIHYAVAGGFTNPLYTSFPWPNDYIDCDCDGMNLNVDDDEDGVVSAVSTKIQKV